MSRGPADPPDNVAHQVRNGAVTQDHGIEAAGDGGRNVAALVPDDPVLDETQPPQQPDRGAGA